MNEKQKELIKDLYFEFDDLRRDVVNRKGMHWWEFDVRCKQIRDKLKKLHCEDEIQVPK